jgi:hypothetical protein
LLEELGCRWYMEGELGKEYPRLRTLSVAQMTITDQPDLMLRRIGGSRWTGMTDWKAIEVTTPVIDSPPDRMHVLLEMDGKGTCWFDDVIFERNV